MLDATLASCGWPQWLQTKYLWPSFHCVHLQSDQTGLGKQRLFWVLIFSWDLFGNKNNLLLKHLKVFYSIMYIIWFSLVKCTHRIFLKQSQYHLTLILRKVLHSWYVLYSITWPCLQPSQYHQLHVNFSLLTQLELHDFLEAGLTSHQHECKVSNILHSWCISLTEHCTEQGLSHSVIHQPSTSHSTANPFI